VVHNTDESMEPVMKSKKGVLSDSGEGGRRTNYILNLPSQINETLI